MGRDGGRRSRGCARRAARPPCTPPGRSPRCGGTSPSPRATPRLSGSAPPDRLVPAPRATTGTPAAWQRRSTSTSCASSSGIATAAGQLAIHREAVALVRPRFLGRGEQRCRRQDRCELGVDGRIEHRVGRAEEGTGTCRTLPEPAFRPIIPHRGRHAGAAAGPGPPEDGVFGPCYTRRRAFLRIRAPGAFRGRLRRPTDTATPETPHAPITACFACSRWRAPPRSPFRPRRRSRKPR